MNKKLVAISFILLQSLFFMNAEGTENQKLFVKGNIEEKTEAVKKSSGIEAIGLARNAIAFALNYRDLLGEDHSLTALALSGVLSLPQNYINNAEPASKEAISDDFFNLYTNFTDETLKIAILNRLKTLDIPLDKFTVHLNTLLKSECLRGDEKRDLTKSILETAGVIGNQETFAILFNYIYANEEPLYEAEVQQAIILLMERSVGQTIGVIRNGSLKDLRMMFDFALENPENSNQFKAEVAENVLTRAITISETVQENELYMLELDAASILAELKWTRAAKSIVLYFESAKKQYANEKINKTQFIQAINCLTVIAPLESVTKISEYISEINELVTKNAKLSVRERVKVPSDDVIICLIQALGKIGDKNSFDTILSITYCPYTNKIIAEARAALQGLKW